VTGDNHSEPWRADGKFFRSGATRVWMHAVTYGPLPGGWPEDFEPDFSRMAAAGFNAIRLFEMPNRRLLDSAWRHGLRVFGGLAWQHNADFCQRPALHSAARVALVRALKELAGHPALAGVYVGNEIPSDLVRWIGPVRVRQAIEDLIALGREVAPDLLFAYANFPTTEYLEPENADFSAFNVYLEDPPALRNYLKRLHHIAGDRPLVISEFGLDSRRNGLARQAEALSWAHAISLDEETAGLTVFAWSDRWWNAHAEVPDWDFGLIDRASKAKPALLACTVPATPPAGPSPSFSVIICTRNGRTRIGACLEAVRQLASAAFETLVVDDGSDDGTADFVAQHFPWARLLRLQPCGLSAARNAGAAESNGEILAFTDDDCQPDYEWLARLCRVFADGRFAAAGGPNLPPRPQSWREAVVGAAPGAPSHVMLDDDEAEHLPGCNLAVSRAAFEAIGGFDPDFHTAGDDVDFCWRLRAAGFRLGFAPGAFVWHTRRPNLRAFLRQQHGYGLAERLLIAKHPGQFSKRGGAKWLGFVYGGGPVRVMDDSIIYHGLMGAAGYQSVTNRMLPLRGLDPRFNHGLVRLALLAVSWLAPRLRAWARNRSPRITVESRSAENPRPAHGDPPVHEFSVGGIAREDLLQRFLATRWKPAGPTAAWDLERLGTRVLLATERCADGSPRTLVRVWGNPSFLPFKT
jgi:GT2 family glycosyltransferase